MAVTHCPRPGVWDLPSVGHPLVIGPLLVSEGPIEHHADVSHGIDAHCRAFEHRPGEEEVLSARHGLHQGNTMRSKAMENRHKLQKESTGRGGVI